MWIAKILLAMLHCMLCYSQVTRKENTILSRKKRYLTFPDGSNFVVTMSYVKGVMIDIPRSVNVLGECDVPFKLPSDTRWFRKRRRNHYVHKRDIYSTLEFALNENGLNGNACVKRMICEAKAMIPTKGKSLVRDILGAIFTFDEGEQYDDHNFKDFCSNSTFSDCDIPLLKFILGSLTNE